MLARGYVRYLASVIDTTKEVTLEPKDVLVVREFQNVFLQDLSSLPLDRELEFVIELLLGTAPISRALYHMALAELQELKTQL